MFTCKSDFNWVFNLWSCWIVSFASTTFWVWVASSLEITFLSDSNLSTIFRSFSSRQMLFLCNRLWASTNRSYLACHSSASLVTLPVEVVDSGPDPGGRELVAGGIELHSIRSSSDSFSESLAFKSRMSLWREKETNSSHRGILTLQLLSFNFSQVQLWGPSQPLTPFPSPPCRKHNWIYQSIL